MSRRFWSDVRTGSFRGPRGPKAIPPATGSDLPEGDVSCGPRDRYPSARALAGEIERWLADEPVSACRDPWSTRLSRRARRHKPLVAGAAARVITALIGLAIGLVAVQKEQQQTESQRKALKLKSDELSRNVEALRRKDYNQSGQPRLSRMQRRQRGLCGRAP